MRNEGVITELRAVAKNEPLPGWLRETLTDVAELIEKLGTECDSWQSAHADLARSNAHLSFTLDHHVACNKSMHAELVAMRSAVEHIAKQTEGYDPMSKIGLIHERARAALGSSAARTTDMKNEHHSKGTI